MQATRSWTAAAGRPHAVLLGQVLRFGVVGSVGFLVDSAVLLLTMLAGAGPYAGRVLSYLAAASTTWALNRAWTFRASGASQPARRQWVRFLLVNLVGFALNYGTYALLVANVPAVAAQPVLGVAAGALVGMGGNFLLSRRYVFAPLPGAAP
ncbi:GtrA family protein [Roseomonas sp. BN140053]|uniref:GtrA family protein n=1 Tax=Roseomonas sp. BN140053 TaxID=3391898 RepID=UPI0039E7EA5F